MIILEKLNYSFSKLSLRANKKSCKKNLSNEKSKNKIFNTGALGAYNATKIVSKNKTYFEKKYRFKFKEKNILITLHPEKSFQRI